MSTIETVNHSHYASLSNDADLAKPPAAGLKACPASPGQSGPLDRSESLDSGFSDELPSKPVGEAAAAPPGQPKASDCHDPAFLTGKAPVPAGAGGSASAGAPAVPAVPAVPDGSDGSDGSALAEAPAVQDGPALAGAPAAVDAAAAADAPAAPYELPRLTEPFPRPTIQGNGITASMAYLAAAASAGSSLQIHALDDAPLDPTEMIDSGGIEALDAKLSGRLNRFVLWVAGTLGPYAQLLTDYAELILDYKELEQRFSAAMRAANGDVEASKKALEAFTKAGAIQREKFQQLRIRNPAKVKTKSTTIGLNLGFGLLGGALAIPAIAALPLLGAGGFAVSMTFAIATCGPPLWTLFTDLVRLNNRLRALIDKLLDATQERILQMEENVLARLNAAANVAQHEVVVGKLDALGDTKHNELVTRHDVVAKKLDELGNTKHNELVMQQEVVAKKLDELGNTKHNELVMQQEVVAKKLDELGTLTLKYQEFEDKLNEISAHLDRQMKVNFARIFAALDISDPAATTETANATQAPDRQGVRTSVTSPDRAQPADASPQGFASNRTSVAFS